MTLKRAGVIGQGCLHVVRSVTVCFFREKGQCFSLPLLLFILFYFPLHQGAASLIGLGAPPSGWEMAPSPEGVNWNTPVTFLRGRKAPFLYLLESGGGQLHFSARIEKSHQAQWLEFTGSQIPDPGQGRPGAA